MQNGAGVGAGSSSSGLGEAAAFSDDDDERERRSSFERLIEELGKAEGGGLNLRRPLGARAAAAAEPPLEVRTVTFAAADAAAVEGGAGGAFPERAVEAAPRASALTAALKERGAAGAGAGLTLRIHAAGHAAPLVLHVSQHSTIHQTISLALAALPGGEASSAHAHELLMAEPDGEPDDDLPPLSREQRVGLFGHDVFALRPAAAPSASASPPSPPSPASSSLVRVWLPRGLATGAEGRSVSVKADAGRTVREVLAEVRSRLYLGCTSPLPRGARLSLLSRRSSTLVTTPRQPHARRPSEPTPRPRHGPPHGPPVRPRPKPDPCQPGSRPWQPTLPSPGRCASSRT